MNLIIVLTIGYTQHFNKLTSHLTCSDSVHYLPRFLCTAISLSGVNLYCVVGLSPTPNKGDSYFRIYTGLVLLVTLNWDNYFRTKSCLCWKSFDFSNLCFVLFLITAFTAIDSLA